MGEKESNGNPEITRFINGKATISDPFSSMIFSPFLPLES
jgi:hypothetical protein